MLAGLATAADVEDLRHFYQDLFQAPDDTGPIDIPGADSLKLISGDLGIEEEIHFDVETLSSRLGFHNSLPFQFNCYKHKRGVLAWDRPDLFTDIDSPDLQRLTLHWHQLCAVHAIIRNTFTDEEVADPCAGLLLADEVGLGKTAVAIAMIGFFNHVKWLIRTDRQVPPVLGRIYVFPDKMTNLKPCCSSASPTRQPAGCSQFTTPNRRSRNAGRTMGT
jgi:hypothetical protein